MRIRTVLRWAPTRCGEAQGFDLRGSVGNLKSSKTRARGPTKLVMDMPLSQAAVLFAVFHALDLVVEVSLVS